MVKTSIMCQKNIHCACKHPRIGLKHILYETSGKDGSMGARLFCEIQFKAWNCVEIYFAFL